MDKKLQINKSTWDTAAPQFFGGTALPYWGPFDICKDKNLFGPIKGKTFLEIGYGSGHSIQYLMSKGAKKIFGIDISETQYQYASEINTKAIKAGRVNLFLQNMEKTIGIEKVDYIYSIYALGWTIDPKKTLSLMFDYLKPGGKLIWSWDHAFFSDVDTKGNLLFVKNSYHDESEIHLNDWKGSGSIYFTYRKVSTWFKLLKDAGFEILDFLEPSPETTKDYTTKYYTVKKASMVPCSMIWICQKPFNNK